MDRSCANCERPIPVYKRQGTTLYCDEATCRTDRARHRQERSRAKGRITSGTVVAIPQGPLPGSAKWWRDHGCDPKRAKAHGVWRYSAVDIKKMKDAFRPHIPASRLGTVTKIVNSGGGLLMPKFDTEGRPSLSPQVRPNKALILDRRDKYHAHGPDVEKRAVARLFFGKAPRLGRPLPMGAARRLKGTGTRFAELIPEDLAQSHIVADKSEPYDPDTGRGDHCGTNLDVLHRHAPEEAKYVMLGDNKRIDYGPDRIEPLRRALRFRHHLEGKLKHIACESSGWATVSNASVSMPDLREVRWLARWIIANNLGLMAFVGVDADWMNFKRNLGAVFRHAMYVCAEYREHGVEAVILAPPVSEGQQECKCKPVGRISDGEVACELCGGYLKGDDDFAGAGGQDDDLIVLDRQEPRERIASFVSRLPIPRQAEDRTARALRGLSLHNRDGWDMLNVPLKTMQKIMHARRPQDVPIILENLRGALRIIGSLKIEKNEFDREDGSIGVAWDWVKRPKIKVRQRFRAVEQTSRLGEFWMQHLTTVEDLRFRVADLERRADERDQRDNDSLAWEFRAVLAEDTGAVQVATMEGVTANRRPRAA